MTDAVSVKMRVRHRVGARKEGRKEACEVCGREDAVDTGEGHLQCVPILESVLEPIRVRDVTVVLVVMQHLRDHTGKHESCLP